MSQERPQPWKFPELYRLAHHFFGDLLGLLRARFGDPPQWPATDFYEIEYHEHSEQYRSFTTPLTRRVYPLAALLSIWGEVVHLASFEPLMEQLRSLVETKQINPTFLPPGFLIPFAKQYLLLSGRSTFDEGIFEEVYKMGEDYLTKESLTGKLFVELMNLKTELDELVLSPQHRVLRLSRSAAKHIWAVATSVEIPELAIFRPGGGDPTPIPGDVVMEAIFKVKSARVNETPLLQYQEYRACALALHLCEPGGGRIEPMAAECEPLVPAEARQRMFRGLTGPGFFSYTLDASVGDRIKKAWPACYALASEITRNSGNVPLPLRIAAKRFATSFEKQGNEDKLIDYVIGLEALLGRENEAISYRIPLRLATLIGGGPAERIRVFDTSKKSYDLRSNLVHGSDQLREHVTIKGTNVPWIDFLLEVQGYLIRCIHLFMKARERSLAKDAVLAIIERAIVSQDRAELERELC